VDTGRGAVGLMQLCWQEWNW